MVQQSELKTLCECFPNVVVQFPEHLNHQVVVRTRCAFPEGVRGLRHPLTVDARQGPQHFPWPRCHIHSGVSLCNGSVKSSLKWLWTMSVRPCRSSTLSVVPSDFNFSNIGARVGGGGPCKRDGAPISTAFLNLSSACLRRITCRALYSAMDNIFLFKNSFSRRRSRQILRTSINAGSRCSKHVFPRFTARHAVADLAMVVVSVPSAGINVCDAVSVPGKSVLSFLSLNTHNFFGKALLVPASIQRCPSSPLMLKLLMCTSICKAICNAVPHIA